MPFRNSDKVWHFFISVALVFVAFLFLTYCVYRRRGSHDFNFFRRVVQSGLFSLVFGVVKEILDAVDKEWIWCVRETSCHFNIWDLAIYIDGVVLGVLVIICVKMFTIPWVPREQPCERTVASSIDCDDDDEENANHAASSKHGFLGDEIPAEISISDESSYADASASTKENTSTSTEELTSTSDSTSDSSTGMESDSSNAMDDDEEQQIPPV
jgi:hypothetical protein